jgi:MFS family permease
MSTRVLIVVILTVFLDLVGYGIMIPLMPGYVTSMNASATAVGFLLGFYSLAQFIATPRLGALSDRYGRRKVILLSLFGNALSMALFAVATVKHALYLLFVSRLLAGATAGNLAACQAAIADVTDKNERAAAMGRVGAGIGLGLMLGPPIGGELKRFGVWAPPAGAAALAGLGVLLSLVLMP